MIRIIKRLLKLAGRDAFKIKLGFLFGFLESIFSALPLIAVFLVLQETDRAGQGNVCSFSSQVWPGGRCSAISCPGTKAVPVMRFSPNSVFSSGIC